MPASIATPFPLTVRCADPFNAEPPPERLAASFITPVPDFFVRSHGAVPVLDGNTHRVRVDGLVDTPLDLSVAALRERFPHHTVRATLQCAGNRRSDMHLVRPVSGVPWAAGAIGTADWTGVRLGDVLRLAGVGAADGLHAVLASVDECEADGERFRFAVSVPLDKAMGPEVLLAWAMNGAALTPEHGFPLRAVVPGYAGVRSPKWLERITVQDRPGDSKPQARDYKLFPPDVQKETADWAQGVTINEMPLNAAICEPTGAATLRPGATVLRGWAQGCGQAVTRVDVSADGGQSWVQARLEQDPGAPWSWTLWNATLDLPEGEHELVCRAWDASGRTQPARAAEIWNWKGYLSAAWPRVRVRVAA